MIKSDDFIDLKHKGNAWDLYPPSKDTVEKWLKEYAEYYHTEKCIDIIADIRNKLGHVTNLISLVERRKDSENKDYIESRLDEATKKARESINFIKEL